MKIQDNISRLIMVGLLALGGCAKDSGSIGETVSSDSGEETSAENGDSGAEQTEMAPPPDSSASENSAVAEAAQPSQAEPIAEPSAGDQNIEQYHSVNADTAEAPRQGVRSSLSEGKGSDEDTQFGHYIVQVNETLSTISKKIYGSTRKWQDLARLNSIINPSLIYPGDELRFEVSDSRSMKFVEKYRARSFSKVTVKKGDTLAHIAGRVLGDQKLWKVIYADNRTAMNDPDKIAPGLVLQFWPESKFRASKTSVKEKPSVVGSNSVVNKNRVPYAPIGEKDSAPETVQPVVVKDSAAVPESSEPAAAVETSDSTEKAPESEAVGTSENSEKAVEAQSVPAADRDASEEAEIMEDIEKELESK